MDTINSMIDAERAQLVAVLEALDAAQWDTPSLCAGWRVRDVVVHLLMPYELSVPRLVVKMTAAGFSFDKMADRWATADSRSHSELIDAIRRALHGGFRFPGAPLEGALSHLVIHGEDIYRPLGISHQIDPHSANVVLDQLTGPRFRRSVAPGLLDGLAFSATDTGWSFGQGSEVRGSASALITTIAGRSAAIGELSGEGAARVERILSAVPS